MNSPPPVASTLPPLTRPTARFMLAHPAHLIALGFGSGLGRIAPGTVGTLWGWLAFLVLDLFLSPAALGGLILLSALVGWWACTLTSSRLGMQLAAFALFRFFDAAKPGPVAWADRHFKGFGARGGFGILLDDLVAAFCTLLLLALGVFLWS